MPRPVGARLAVPVAVFTLALLAAPIPSAAAGDGCRPSGDGIVCGFSGSSRSSGARSAPGTQPPLRYLTTSGGACWYWARYPPGLDSWDPANDHAIIFTRRRLPQCRARTAPTAVVNASTRAWRVFRAFPLDAPRFRLSPHVGITNLPSRLHLEAPSEFAHRETLPDGRRLEVVAAVTAVWIDWRDGTPLAATAPAGAVGDPGIIRHTYSFKTCTLQYRSHHLDGPKCHPKLDRYPVRVTFEWTGRYRTGGSWVALGSINRAGHLDYDVDEVLGVLVTP